VWDLKQKLEGLQCGSGLEMRVGSIADVARDFLEFYAERGCKGGKQPQITGIWLTDDDGTEEKDDERTLKNLAAKHDVAFKVWEDEKFYIDECVIPAFIWPLVWHCEIIC
jgi:deoxyribodipyrimidine photo-lyase